MQKLALLPVAAASLLVLAPAASARADSSEDVSIGTRPAQAAPPAKSAASPLPSLDVGEAPRESEAEPEARRRLQVAGDPGTDWAVLHAGFRPHVGTFGGIATLALAHART